MEAKPNQEIGTRIKELIFKIDMNQTTFAKSVGVSQNAIFNTVNGQTQPRYSLLDKILKTYPQINRDWLLDGKGEMFNNTPSLPVIAPDNYLKEYLRGLENKFEKLSEQLAVKDKQIDRLMDLLGKPDVNESTTCIVKPLRTQIKGQIRPLLEAQAS